MIATTTTSNNDMSFNGLAMNNANELNKSNTNLAQNNNHASTISTNYNAISDFSGLLKHAHTCSELRFYLTFMTINYIQKNIFRIKF